jgi:proline iminopeptidase
MESYRDGMLDAGDGQFLHWEQCGNPGGKPAVVLHGGPGSGCSPWMRQLFDPDVYRVVLFDQRGAGRSLPHASEPSADLSVNTTAHLVADIEWLREHLGVERWLIHGMSWGSSLGLAYAEAHPQRVSEVVLAAVTMTRRCDVDWFARGVGRFFPAQWQAFRDGVPAADRDGDLVSVYARLLASPDPTVREQAARNWCDWEEAIVSLATGALRIRVTPTRASGWALPAWSPTTSLTPRGSRTISFCAKRTGSPGSPPSLSTAVSIWVARCAPPGAWPEPGRGVSS